MSEPIRLYVYDPAEDFDEALPASAITPADWSAAPPPWQPDLFETLLWIQGVEDPLVLSPFGRLPAIAIQLDEAADRLEAWQRALLRTAGDWTAIFLALEPDGDEVVASALAPLPRPLVSYYPVANSPYDPLSAAPIDQRAELHAYVEAHRGELIPDKSDGGPEWRVQGLRWDRSATIAALRSQAAGAHRLSGALLLLEEDSASKR